MSETREARKQWHPVLVDGLRYLLGERLRIEPEHAVAALPTRIDVLVASPASTGDLESPYDRLAPTTLLELESPGEWATWRSLRKLYADGVLFSLDQDQEMMAGIGLWLIASRLSAEFLSLAQQEVGPLEIVEPGLWQGSFIGSPVLLVHLHELPVSLSTLPLLMVYRGPREREIAQFALEHGQQYSFFAEQAIAFHPRAVREALMLRGMNVEAYRQIANVKDIVALFGPRILIEEIGEEEVIRTIGEEEIIRTIGEEEIIRTIGEEEIIRTIGEDRLRELLDRMAQDRKERDAETP